MPVLQRHQAAISLPHVMMENFG